MSAAARPGPVILLGCGRLGSAILEGWLKTGAVAPESIIVLTPSKKPVADEAAARGARLNPPLAVLAEAYALVIAVKPAKWREALLPLLPHLAADVALISVMAGVMADDIASATNRTVIRVMPTTAVAQAKGVAAVWAGRPEYHAVAHALFEPLADVVDLADEGLMNAATAVAGSAPAFLYAFTQALAWAGEARGLAPDAAVRLATGALRSAGAGADTGVPLTDLIARIASPGGTTQAGLDAMSRSGDLERAAEAAVKAAVDRAGELSA
ncbi:MAG: NAD(P)-binding domain-containing protein [Brevundimonas sp.]|uniref:pyrroline-5-carboxylate reductase family protein n=1 Tax=Brevundimonas sp. TaxID=1871086 RepID=UPI001A290B5C|nr:pyrroline-5-carboxylate reductase dimerization domain-containing protein [Brevundimonas sp.]MBJ7448602.1 NAD(P)-binding domain-containing protein [Brevundimonas sp.]